MSGAELGLALSVFLACTVEAVEATTIVLAAGTARDWRSALCGLFAALVTLAVLIGALGPALSAVPLHALRLVVGGLLLVFGFVPFKLDKREGTLQEPHQSNVFL